MYTLSNSPRDPAAPARRPYLSAERRRLQLLEGAAQLVARDGLDNLSMTGLARHAGVSRQLVYEHFSDLPELVAALLRQTFGEPDQNIADVLTAGGASPRDAALVAARVALSRPVHERRLLRSLLVSGATPGHPLAPLASQFRERSIARWSAVLGAEREPSRALIWALVNGVLALGELVDAGELTLEQALTEAQMLIGRAVGAAPS